MKPFVLPSFADTKSGPNLAGESWAGIARALAQCVAAKGAGFDGLLQAVVEGAVDTIPRAGSAMVEMRSGERLFLRAASGRSGASVGRDLPIAGTLSGRCIAERRPLTVSDTGESGARSVLVAPIVQGGEVVGLLKLCSPDPAAFAARDLDLATWLAASISAGLAGAAASAAPSGADQRFAASFHQAAIGIAHFQPSGRFLLANDRFCEIADRGRDQLIGTNIAALLHPDDTERASGLIATLLAGAIGSYEAEQRFVRRDGRATWVGLTVSLVRTEGGAADFCVAIAEDIDARKQAELQAGHDPLTGLLNPRGLQERLERELDRKANDGDTLTVALIDLAGVDRVNEKLGATEGDRCLQRVAAVLRQLCRPGDAVARVGGNEFVLAMPGLDGPGADAFLARAEAAIARLGQKAGWPIGCRIGAATRLRDGATAASLIAAAAARLTEGEAAS